MVKIVLQIQESINHGSGKSTRIIAEKYKQIVGWVGLVRLVGLLGFMAYQPL